MKNNNKLVNFVTFTVLITMIALILVSGTYAKYTTAVSGTDTATVAKWQVKLDGKDITTSTDAITFDLFSETGVYDLASVTDPDNLSQETGTVDDDVTKTGAKIAPGTWGKVTFALENDSEVTANYAVTIDELTTTLPLEFSVDGSTWQTASEIATAIKTKPYEVKKDTLEIGSQTPTTATVSLYWKWDFEAGADETDTNLGAAGTATCSIKAGVVFEQAN